MAHGIVDSRTEDGRSGTRVCTKVSRLARWSRKNRGWREVVGDLDSSINVAVIGQASDSNSDPVSNSNVSSRLHKNWIPTTLRFNFPILRASVSLLSRRFVFRKYNLEQQVSWLRSSGTATSRQRSVFTLPLVWFSASAYPTRLPFPAHYLGSAPLYVTFSTRAPSRETETERVPSPGTKGGNLRSLNGVQTLDTATRCPPVSVFRGSNVRAIAVKAFIRGTPSCRRIPR